VITENCSDANQRWRTRLSSGTCLTSLQAGSVLTVMNSGIVVFSGKSRVCTKAGTREYVVSLGARIRHPSKQCWRRLRVLGDTLRVSYLSFFSTLMWFYICLFPAILFSFHFLKHSRRKTVLLWLSVYEDASCGLTQKQLGMHCWFLRLFFFFHPLPPDSICCVAELFFSLYALCSLN
jgi:hypothetical protein